MEKNIEFYKMGILRAIDKISEYSENMKQGWQNDELTFDACCMQAFRIKALGACYIELAKGEKEIAVAAGIKDCIALIFDEYCGVDQDAISMIPMKNLPKLKDALNS